MIVLSFDFEVVLYWSWSWDLHERAVLILFQRQVFLATSMTPFTSGLLESLIRFKWLSFTHHEINLPFKVRTYNPLITSLFQFIFSSLSLYTSFSLMKTKIPWHLFAHLVIEVSLGVINCIIRLIPSIFLFPWLLLCRYQLPIKRWLICLILIRNYRSFNIVYNF